jgi:antitoxin MazE6
VSGCISAGFNGVGTRKSDRHGAGYTPGMKTAVSIPDDVFEKVERLARRSSRSRSEVFSAALREYVARHAPDEVTESMNKVCESVGGADDTFVAEAARRVLDNSEW